MEPTDPERLSAGALRVTILRCRKRNDRSPLRLARDDNKNNHRAETEASLRRIGRSPEHGTL
jgi:hypothetical protein